MTKTSSSIKSYIINPPDVNSPNLKMYNATVVHLNSILEIRSIQALRINDALRALQYELEVGERIISISEI